MAGTIFLNYRRGDDAGTVGRIFDRLEAAFGRDRLFMDVEGHIKAGDDYVDVLRGQVAACDVLLAVIGPRWLTIPDEHGRRRLDNPEDWVRVEIVSALQASSAKRVIPVLVGGGAMPRAEDLPPDLQALARKQAVRITLERFKSDTQGLVDQVTGVFADMEAARAASATERAAADAARAAKEQAEAERAAAVASRGDAERAAGMSAADVRKAEELANWSFIKERNDIDEVRDHLARFPGGVTERYAKAALEAAVWATLGPQAPRAELQTFIEGFPGSAHVAEASGWIAAQDRATAETMAAADRAARETAEWAAVASGDKAAVMAFLKAWPDGQHAASAQARLKELRGGGRFNRRAILKGVGYGVGGTVVAGGAAVATLVPGMPVWRMIHDQSVRTLTGHADTVLAIAITPDGKSAVAANYYKSLNIWDIATGRELHKLTGHTSSVWAVAITPDGKTAISGGTDKTLRLWDIASSRELRTLAHSADVWAVAITPNGKTMLSCSEDTTLKVWDIASGRELRTLTGHSFKARAVAITPDGKTAISGSEDKTLKVWDIASGRELRTLMGHTSRVWAVAITPDGKTVISGSEDTTLKIWDVATGGIQRYLTGHIDTVRSVAITPNGKSVLSGSGDHNLKVWDLASGRELRTLTGHTGRVCAVAITPDGKTAVSGSADGTLKVWDLTR